MTHKLWISLVAIGLCVGGLPTGSALAKPAATKTAPGPSVLSRDFLLAPDGLRWGISFPMVSKVYDDAFEAEYAPILKNTEPGRQMELLESELSEKKGLIRRSKVDFGSQPTGVDSGPLNGEYGYNNGESMAKIILRGGTVRYFFFYTDRLWKVYDEYKIGKGSKLGSSWEDAVKTLTDLLGGPPQLLEPDAGRSFQEAVWTTATMQIRAVNRSHQNVVAVAWSDRGVGEKIASGRKANKLANPTAMDSKVRDVTQPDPNVMKLKTGPSAPETKTTKKK
jgi:hypothetical protein